jgi:cytochrome bd-type quinol oxidase subunit 2
VTLDLPLIWAGIIATAVLLYVLLDGFDLGIGILFPFASPRERDVMMDTIAPVWDGNETWLVLGGGGLFAAFPFAFAAIMPALYIPILIMLLALILRGVAFEFRLHGRARRWAWLSLAAVAVLLAAVSLATLYIHPRVAVRWGWEDGRFDVARLAPLLPVPLLGLAGLALAALGLRRGSHGWPFAGAVLMFLSGYLGLAAGFFPNIVPYAMTFRQAANPDNTLGLLLVGAAILLPAIVGYSLWVYWIFRGKVSADEGYH